MGTDSPLHEAPKAEPKTTTDVLVERGARYGEFAGKAVLIQDLKNVMRHTANWGGLDADMKEALEMIAHKIGRILNGDPTYEDSWRDIAGYAQLVADRLLGVTR